MLPAEAHLAAGPAVVADQLLAAVLGAGVAEGEVAGEMLAADIARAAGRRGLALRKIRVQVGARHAVELAEARVDGSYSILPEGRWMLSIGLPKRVSDYWP